MLWEDVTRASARQPHSSQRVGRRTSCSLADVIIFFGRLSSQNELHGPAMRCLKYISYCGLDRRFAKYPYDFFPYLTLQIFQIGRLGMLLLS